MDKDLLYRFFEGHASLEDMKVVKEWADASEENAGLLRRERKLFNAMILAGHSRRTDIQRMRNRRNYFIREFLKIASVIVITVSVTAVLFSIGKDNEDMYLAMQTITVPAGQRVNLDLPDGSNVWLNAGTTMQYPVSFMTDKREVILDGEAYFEVVHNEKSPFVVHTSTLDVEVLGTKFNVEGYSDKDDFEVTLMEGSVRVASRIGLGDTLMLKPDSKACLQKDGRLKVIPVDDYNPYRWKEGLICFRNESFLSIMNDLEKYFGVSIVVENKNVLKYYFTGKFRQADGIDYALRVLQRDIRFKYERDDENQIIYIR